MQEKSLWQQRMELQKQVDEIEKLPHTLPVQTFAMRMAQIAVDGIAQAIKHGEIGDAKRNAFLVADAVLEEIGIRGEGPDALFEVETAEDSKRLKLTDFGNGSKGGRLAFAADVLHSCLTIMEWAEIPKDKAFLSSFLERFEGQMDMLTMFMTLDTVVHELKRKVGRRDGKRHRHEGIKLAIETVLKGSCREMKSPQVWAEIEKREEVKATGPDGTTYEVFIDGDKVKQVANGDSGKPKVVSIAQRTFRTYFSEVRKKLLAEL